MNWLEAQRQITDYLAEILARIEWHYGDNRAPFLFPPEFSKRKVYKCVIQIDDSDQDKNIISAASAELLVERVKIEIANEYISWEE